MKKHGLFQSHRRESNHPEMAVNFSGPICFTERSTNALNCTAEGTSILAAVGSPELMIPGECAEHAGYRITWNLGVLAFLCSAQVQII